MRELWCQKWLGWWRGEKHWLLTEVRKGVWVEVGNRGDYWESKLHLVVFKGGRDGIYFSSLPFLRLWSGRHRMKHSSHGRWEWICIFLGLHTVTCYRVPARREAENIWMKIPVFERFRDSNLTSCQINSGCGAWQVTLWKWFSDIGCVWEERYFLFNWDYALSHSLPGEPY